MNHNSTLTRSRWLLLTLFTLLVGVSPAWATKAILSEGFESNSLATNGWTVSNAGSSGIYSGAKRTGSYGYRFYYYSSGGPRYLISPELTIPANASDINLSFYHASYSTSYGDEKFKVGYSTTTNSTDAFTWSDEQIDNSTDWKEYTDNTIPKETKYIAIQYTSGNAYYLFIDDFNLTCEVNGPAFDVKDGSTPISSPYDYSFGLTTAGTTKTFTLSNPGTAATPISVDVTGANGFTAAVEDNATSIPAGGEKTLTITMPNATASGSVVVTPTGDGLSAFTFNVSGTAKDPSKLWCDFTSDLPSGWDNTGGWAISNSGADGITSGGGYASNTSYGTNKRMFTPLVTIAEGEKLYSMVKGHGSTASWNKLYIQYSANGTDWTTAKSLESITNTWQSVEVTEIPAGNWYIGFYGSYVHITDIYGGTESTAPVLSLSQSSYDFGLINENTTSTAITITNTGKSELTGMNLVSSNAAFTFNVTDDATTIAANGGTATFTVTMSSANAGTKNGTITIKSDNADDLVLNVSGAVMKAGTTTETFNNNQKPERWTNSSDTYYYWNFSDGKASAGSGSQYSNYAYMITPKMTVSADDFLAIKIKAQNSNYGFLKVYTSTDGTFGSTPVKEISYSELSTSDYKTIIVNGLTSEVKYFKFEGYYVTLDEIAGLTYAPVLVVKDAEDAVQASPVAYAFGEQGANASVTYSFTNGGAGTLNITNVAVTNDPADGTYTTNWSESVATPFDLVITQNYDAEKAGAKTGSVVVTMSDASTFTINLSGTLLAANAPTLAVDNTLEFGKLTANYTKKVTVTNSGTGSMTVDIVSDNTLFTVSPAQLTEIGAGASKTFDVTFHYDQVTAGNYGVKNANITVTPTYNAEAAVVISASAKAKDPEEWGEDFAGNALPDGWEVTGYTDKWTFENGIASSSYSSNKGYLETPLLTVAENDVLSFQAKSTFNGSVTIKVYKKAGAGDWENTAFKTISLASSDYGIWKDYTIENLVAGTYKFRFENEDYALDNFEGFKRNVNDPKLEIYTDADCTIAATTTETKDFGFVEADATVTYYIKNGGTGTMMLSKGDNPVGFTATLDKTSVAAGEHATLTITMPEADNAGYHSGNVVVTATDLGTFTVTATGVVIDANKLYLDFTQNSTELPVNWENKWSKNGDGYPRAGYSKVTMETGKLVAEANEKIVIVAKNESYSDVFGLNYRAVGDEDWTVLIAEAAIGTDWNTLTATIPAAGNYQLQFVGKGALIQRIYGLAMPLEPVMVVYDGENVAGATKNFGMVSDEADAVWTLTVKNEGQAKLEGLAAALSGEQAAHYSAEITGATGAGNDEIEVGTQATVTVKQLKDNLGAHEATLTISATGLDSKVIALSGSTRDHTLLYVDFDGSNDWPSAVASHGANWDVYAGYARQTSTTASSLVLAPLSISQASEALRFKASRYNNDRDLKVRYTTNGGVTWNDYNFGTNETPVTSLKDQITSTSSYNDFEITNIPAGTVAFDFYGQSVKLDNIAADYVSLMLRWWLSLR